MDNATSYWAALCAIVPELRCWLRIAWRDGDSTEISGWTQMLIMPVEGYIEAWGGPIPLRSLEWVEISTTSLNGGLAGLPLQMVDVETKIVAALQKTQLQWEPRNTTWSKDGLFDNIPVQVLHFANPYAPAEGTHL